MKRLILIISMAAFPIVLFCQVEKDSTFTGIDSLLNKNIKRTEYVRSASKYSQALYESPNSLNVISQNAIHTYGYSLLSEALNNADEIYINNDLNYQYIGISGFGRPTDNNNRVQLLFDGHRLNDYVYNAIPIDEFSLDVNNYDRIEVITGPGSVLYGGNAMFGVINILPHKGGENFIPKIRATYGSYNSKSISALIGYGSENDFSINLHAFYYNSDGRNYYFPEFDTEENNHGIINNLDGENKRGVYASIKYGDFELFGVSSYRFKEVPTAPYAVDFGSRVETTDIYNFWEGRYSKAIGFDKQITLRLYYDQYKYSGLYIYNTAPTWDANDSKSVGAEIQFLWDPLPFDRVIIGAEFNKAYKVEYNYWDETQMISEFEVPISNNSLFLQNEYHFSNNFGFYLAARLDSYDNSETKFSPRATLIYSPDDRNTIRFLAGTSFRNPAAYEKYYEDVYGGYKKNESLSPEQILSFQLNWDMRLSQLFNLSLNTFHNQISSFIEQVIDPNDNMQYYSNLANIKSYGFGVSLKADADENKGGYISFQYQHARDGNGEEIVAAPGNMVKLGFYYKALDFLKIGFEHRYEASKITVYGTTLPAINYSSLNIYNPVKIVGLNFALTIKNLFNNSIQSPGGLQNKQVGLPMPGRNYLLNVGFGL